MVAGAIVLAASSAANSGADTLTECTRLQFCYCVNSELNQAIDEHVERIRQLIREQRSAGKAIGYQSVPISTAEGSYLPLNSEVAAEVKRYVEARFGPDDAWLLNPADKNLSLPAAASGADYILMWTRVLEGPDGLGSDFDFVYFVGPSDFGRKFGFDGKADAAKVDAYYDQHAPTDDRLREIDKRKFRNYYALRASVSFSYGSHDEWNIVRAINDKRRAADPNHGIVKQLAVLFDGHAVAPGLFDAAAAPGDAGACRAN
jgi:hypothetical protein